MRNRRNRLVKDAVNSGLAVVQTMLAEHGFTITPNGYGHRARCNQCGWSKADVTIPDAIDHASTH